MKEVMRKALAVGEREFECPVLEYENMAEIETAAKDKQVAVTKFCNFLYYHGAAGSVRDLIVECVTEVTGKKPNESTKKVDGKDVKVVENADPFVNRIIAADMALFDKVQALVTKKAREKKIALDIAKARQPGSGKPKELAKQWKALALPFLKGEKSLDKFNKAAEKAGVGVFVPEKGVPPTDEKNVVALGWLLKGYQAWHDQQNNAFKTM